MTGFTEILGHAPTLDQLRRMLREERIPHAMLFGGPAQVGKATVARAMAAALLCTEEGIEACGRCSSCHLLESGNHPDYLEVRLLPKKMKPPFPLNAGPDDGKEELRKLILVDQIRELNRLAGVAPRRGKRRIFLIDPADRMINEAQNALLKTIEEPPGHGVLFLIASQPHLLLPTVRSRCFVFGLSPMRAADLVDGLTAQGMAREEARARAALAEGRPGLALTLDPERQLERRDIMLGWIEAIATDPNALADLPAMAAAMAGKDDRSLRDSLDLLESLLRDAARAGLDDADPELIHTDVAARLGHIGRELGTARAAQLVRGIEGLRGQLRLNLNRVLVAESLLAAVAGGPLP